MPTKITVSALKNLLSSCHTERRSAVVSSGELPGKPDAATVVISKELFDLESDQYDLRKKAGPIYLYKLLDPIIKRLIDKLNFMPNAEDTAPFIRDHLPELLSLFLSLNKAVETPSLGRKTLHHYGPSTRLYDHEFFFN